MIETLLNRIAGLFDKDFLFASLIPALIFLPGIVVTLAVVTGFRANWEWVASFGALEKAAALALIALVLIVSGYLLNAMRPAFRLARKKEDRVPRDVPETSFAIPERDDKPIQLSSDAVS